MDFASCVDAKSMLGTMEPRLLGDERLGGGR